MKIGESKSHGTLWVTSGLLRESFNRQFCSTTLLMVINSKFQFMY